MINLVIKGKEITMSESKVAVSTYLTLEQKQKLERLAKKEHRSVANLLSVLVDNATKKQK